MGRRAEADCLL